MTDLPRLSSADLVARFGDDEAALRRYRMLAAVIREGRSPGEVARTFGVSRESLRRLRVAFNRHGLDAIQSRRRGGGHLATDTPLARAIRQHLADEPGVPAGILWRRVQAHLSEAGVPAPRSTFYRLVAQLRDEERAGAGGSASLALLRDALGAMAEDPPIQLGRSGLAELLLPEVRDPLRRGRQLQRAIRAAVERLHPAEAGPVLDDPRWRHYLIIAGEYETGEKRSALQGALALSASTYSRAKREALERLIALLPDALGELPPPEPPMELIAPPDPPTSFDHEAELAGFMARLRQSGLALIWGPAGVGKRAVAAMLAARLRERGQKVVWHACQPPDASLNAGHQLLIALAAALARDDRPALWDSLGSPEAVALGDRLELLADGLRDCRWTVIVADAHWLSGDVAARVLDELTAAQERRDLRLVLVSRELPGWADPQRWPPLPFPSDAAARQAFIRRLSEKPPDLPTLEGSANLRSQVIELIAAVPVETFEHLSDAQIAQILAIIRPVEELADELRAALRAAADGGDSGAGQ